MTKSYRANKSEYCHSPDHGQMVMVNGEILHQKLPQDLRLGPIWECTKVLNLYSSNKNSLLETGLLRMFMYAELHVSWLYYCWAPLTYFFHYALWLLRKMTVKSVRSGGRGVSHCSPTLHLHCWLAQRSCTVVYVYVNVTMHCVKYAGCGHCDSVICI